MKKIYFISITLALFSCNSEVNNKENALIVSISTPSDSIQKGSIKNINIGCGYNYKPTESEIDLYLPRQREVDEIKKILSFSGIPLNFEIFSAEIDNAVATIIDNKRYIIYDTDLLISTDRTSNSFWNSMSILAHEVGHHLSGHTLNNDVKGHQAELEADKFSGFVLYKMGASLEQAKNAMINLGSEVESESHPSKVKRLKSIEDGWTEASHQRYSGAIPPPPNDKDLNTFCDYTAEMLIDKEHLEADNSNNWYGEYKFIYGIITEVDDELNFAKIHVVKSSNEFTNDFRSIDNEDWDVSIDQNSWGGNNEMGHSCSMGFKYLMVPGRRLRFSMVEGYPGCGTIMNGVWFLTSAKALDENTFLKLTK